MSIPVTNEAGVREAIIAPILQLLNYSAQGPNDIRYEVQLVYPREYLGRKKSGTDLSLVGKADYLCRAGGRVGWTIEAKPPLPITEHDIQQAYSYAKHPEVRAVYFTFCNGIEFRIYDTNSDPAVGPILVVDDCEDSRGAALKLSRLLGAEALLSRHALVLADIRPPIGRGLLSFAQIIGGQIVHDNTVAIHALRGFTVSVTGGAIQRTVDNTLVAYFEERAPYAGIQATIDSLGLGRVVAHSDSENLSTDAGKPTTFRAQMSATFPKGQWMLNLMTHSSDSLPLSLVANIQFEAAGRLDGGVFAGNFCMKCACRNEPQSNSLIEFQMASQGAFEFLLK